MQHKFLINTISVVTVLFVALLVLIVCGRPLDRTDIWFHLKMGEVYATEGLWPSEDPMLHTAEGRAPVQHEWLFGVLAHFATQLCGFHALRVAQVLMFVLVVGFVARDFFRVGGSWSAGACATGMFIVVSWWRLMQPRPHVFSIAATLVVAHLLFDPDKPPSKKCILGVVALLVVWANMHSVFLIGLLLMGAAVCGGLAHMVLQRYVVQDRVSSTFDVWMWAVRIAGPMSLQLRLLNRISR